MPTPEFHAEDKQLKQILFAGEKFRIPRYQRPYAWGAEQIAELWEDVMESKDSYFLGSFIFNSEHVEKDGLLDIIDGQQRILSITIFCAALRDAAKPLDKEKARLYQWQDISLIDRDGKHDFRVLAGETVADFFRDNVQKEKANMVAAQPSTPEERRIKENYLDLAVRIAGYLKKFNSNEAKLDCLDDLRNRLSKLIVIRVDIQREEDAYEIFETTNARGLELSVADLLKNLIFRKLPPKAKKDIAKTSWNEITSNVESTKTELRKFIRYFWLSKYRFLSEKKLYRAIKNQKDEKEREIDYEQLLADLVQASSWYNRMVDGVEGDFKSLKNGPKLYESLFALRLMGVSQCYVLFLSIFRNFEQLGTDPTRIFQMVERFSFKYSVICKQPANKVEKLYSQTAIAIENAVKLEPKKRPIEVQRAFADLEKNLKSLLPVEAMFKESFRTVAYKNTEEARRLIKYILSRVNSHLSQTAEQKIDFNVVNIEHLLPQKPHKDWNLDRKEVKPYVNLLGNLTLISKKLNFKAQHMTIKYKMTELKKSELPVTKVVVKAIEDGKLQWGEQQIKERQEELADLAYKKIWV